MFLTYVLMLKRYLQKHVWSYDSYTINIIKAVQDVGHSYWTALSLIKLKAAVNDTICISYLIF